MTPARPSPQPSQRTDLAGGQSKNLALATLAFTINFWAWALVGPLSTTYSRALHLNATQTSVLVAIPVLVGAVGRIPVGVLTDRFGGRLMFTVVTALTILPVVFEGVSDSYGALLVGGFFLGIGGTTFAIGIPFVNAWYEPARRGFATGVFGMGMGGTALSAFFTPRLVDAVGRTQTHMIIAAALAVVAVVMWLASRDSPAFTPSTTPAMPRLAAAARLPVTWKLSALYAVTFGGFVALSNYLPTLLKTVYDLSQTSAGTRTAGFSLAAVIARPIGGVLSDRIHPKPVLLVSLVVTTVLALVASTDPALEFQAGATYILLALALGLGTGATFAFVARLTDPARVGSVSGIVGAAGGLGGYFPPLVMGVIYQNRGSYALGYVLLAATAAAALVFTIKVLPGRGAAGRPVTA